MRIIYIGKFDQPHSNDDEGAIAHALTTLGHDVQCVREKVGHRATGLRGDMVLFHHWDDLTAIRQFGCPKVFWYFDLVDYPDPTLTHRCEARKNWMSGMLPVVDMAFLTDGDYVDVINNCGLYSPEKAHWLQQGVDVRVTGPGTPSINTCESCNRKYTGTDILFTGISKGGGEKRISFVEEMKATYGDRFLHVERKIHGRDLANLIADSKIVVCPDSPVTDKYWSNRVYLMLGFQAFVLHPYTKGLADQYGMSGGIMAYHDRRQLHDWIRDYLQLDESRSIVAKAGYDETMKNHTYIKRCEKLIDTVKQQLKI